MEAILPIILLIGLFVGIIYLKIMMRKGLNAVSRKVCQNVVFKDKYQKGQELVTKPLVFRTSASISDIMRELMAHVTTIETPLGFKRGVYQLSCDEHGVVYAFGNNLHPQSFVAKITFSNSGKETEGVFRVINWREDPSAGMLVGQEAIDKLRKEVQEAFMTIGNIVNAEEKKSKIFCRDCGVENLSSAKFCKGCGKQVAVVGN